MAESSVTQVRALLTPQLVIPEMKAREKKDALHELCAPLAAAHPDLDHTEMVRVLLEREKLGSTGVGDAVAIPHGKLPELDHIVAAFGRSSFGIEFAALDDKPAKLFFVLFAPSDAAAAHLKVLARISRLLKNPDFRQKLLTAQGAQGVLDRIEAEEREL